MTGTFDCATCGETFTEDNPLWNSWATYADGSADDGECKRCAEKRTAGQPRLDFVNHRGE